MLLRSITLALAIGSGVLIGQDQERRPTFSATSDLVVIHEMVEDGRGAAVPGLESKDFIVYEDNRPQSISFFTSTDVSRA